MKNPVKQRYYEAHKKEISERAAKYRQTPRGYLTWVYQNMRKRVAGKDPGKEHLYEGLPILTSTEFAQWAMSDADFLTIFDGWTAQNFAPYKGPSIDRIKSDQGYVKGNMRWVTHAQNSRDGAISRWAA